MTPSVEIDVVGTTAEGFVMIDTHAEMPPFEARSASVKE